MKIVTIMKVLVIFGVLLQKIFLLMIKDLEVKMVEIGVIIIN